MALSTRFLTEATMSNRFPHLGNDVAQAGLDIVDWIEGYYNRQRLHTSIDFLTPVDYESRRTVA
jgi:transposase InsO family protein